jgi:ferric-dicitrate binding protein FerR (iron transport regulator)
VLGTEFDVKDWDGYYEVTCFSGSVQVITEDNTIILTPNEAFQIVNGSDEQYTVTGKEKPDWQQEESSFNSVPLHFVIEELERQYDISIETKNVDLRQLFTGSFSHNNLKIALESVTVPANLTYEIKDKKVLINIDDK